MSDPLQLLRDANPRTDSSFDTAARNLVAGLLDEAASGGHDRPPSPRRRARAPRIIAATATAAGIAAAIAVGISTGGHAGPSRAPAQAPATAQALVLAAARTAVAADQSGTAEVRISHDGVAWAGATIVWNHGDLAVTKHAPGRGQAGSELRVVNGTVYGQDDHGNWVVEGTPANIDPGSGATPSDYLAAVRADVGGATLQRITGAMQGLTTQGQADGSTVYRGTVAAGLVAQDTGFKEGETLRVLPFGYVAHDKAADPNASLSAAITVGADHVLRSITVWWGVGETAWVYQVTYSGLGATAAPQAPAGARPLRDTLRH